MARDNINDIIAFIAIARERSFTRAAAKLGTTQSALSHTIRALETRLGVRLLTRTTRSVSPTDAGERLLQNVAPRLDEIEAEIIAVRDLGDKPAGKIRIAATDFVIDTILWPRLATLLPSYPDLLLEISSDNWLVDVAADRYDIGVRFGSQVEKDMIAVRVTSEVRMMIVGSPSYFDRYTVPTSPEELTEHNCITLGRADSGGSHPWGFLRKGHAVEVAVRGQAVFSSAYHVLNAALSGCGLALVPEDLAVSHVFDGQLVSVLSEWCPTFPGLYAFYPSRRHSNRALTLVLDAIRHKEH